jgi:hypothetical protein
MLVIFYYNLNPPFQKIFNKVRKNSTRRQRKGSFGVLSDDGANQADTVDDEDRAVSPPTREKTKVLLCPLYSLFLI